MSTPIIAPVWTRVRRGLVVVDDAMWRAHDDLSEGQRWTAALALALTALVLLFGTPRTSAPPPAPPPAVTTTGGSP